jgi:hypothetical protein
MTDKDKITAGMTRIITRQQQSIRALRDERNKLEGEIARLERLVCAVVRWHFAEGGSEPELIIDELENDERPTELPFIARDKNGVRTLCRVGRVLR